METNWIELSELRFFRGSLMEKAMRASILYHNKQFDKSGTPYYEHPLNVYYLALLFYEKNKEVKSLHLEKEQLAAVALLHDVMEDCNVSEAELRFLGFPDAVIRGVKAITRNEEETHKEYIQRCMRNDLAHIVKIADIIHNMELSRYFRNGVLPSKQELGMLEKRYIPAYKTLMAELTTKCESL